MYLFLQKGWTLMDFSSSEPIIQSSDPNRNCLKGRSLTGDLANGQVGTAKPEGATLLDRKFPSSKLSPGLSNQPKLPIYSFWQSQSQIANLSPILWKPISTNFFTNWSLRLTIPQLKTCLFPLNHQNLASSREKSNQSIKVYQSQSNSPQEPYLLITLILLFPKSVLTHSSVKNLNIMV